MNAFIDSDKVEAVSEILGQAKRVAITCHMTPDGDAMGSSLCLMHTLRRRGLEATVVVPDSPPENLMFLPGAKDIVVASRFQQLAHKALGEADVVFCLDYNDLKRIDRMASLVDEAPGRRIVIDHHLNPVIEGDVVISHPEKSSTCCLVLAVIDTLGMMDCVDIDAATCCCAGMMTDTGNFSYNANDPALYGQLEQLMQKGVDKDALYVKLFNTATLGRLRIMAYAQLEKMHVMPMHHAALIWLSRQELDEFSYRRGDTEGLVNIPLSLEEVTYSIFLREDEPGYVKVSMRSKGNFSVKDLCEKHFAGGGHHNAAGGEIYAPIQEAVAATMAIIESLEFKV